MVNKYVTTLIKITNHVSQINLITATGISCSLLDNNHKNLPFATCSEIRCSDCAFSNSNHNKINSVVNKGNSNG